ncbi:MAG TPA: tyrosine-type recombinase/integrase [Ktedonobacteraceae bacterium]|nr:tyrosine-type recombinase/integrase [Ktedonobacteraceae bacterium]
MSAKVVENGHFFHLLRFLDMETIAKRAKQSVLSGVGEHILAQYERRLRVEEDLSSATIRNYLSGLRQFMAWCESIWQQGRENTKSFVPEAVTSPTLTHYRTYLQALQLKPNSINRSLISLKRYFAWLITTGQLTYDPAKVVKLVGEEVTSPHHLDDREEQALVAAVKKKGTVQDQAIIVFMLHTGLRAREVCTLTRAQVHLGKRSGSIIVHGKRNKYREVPLNATARAALEAYDPLLTQPHAQDATPLFRSETAYTAHRARIRVSRQKYAEQAKLCDVSPHDLRHRFGYRMAGMVPLHRLAQIMGHDSLDTTMLYVQGTKDDLQQAVETIAWT